MTEFGKSPLLTAKQLSDIGYNVVIYPVTTLRLAMFAVEAGLREIDSAGGQFDLLDRMQHRSRLYSLLRYEAYNEFDTDTYNFALKGTDDDGADR
jgi:methylisocitrate lyase